MRIALAIFKYFPYGGLARDLRKIAAECLRRGHRVRVYAMRWQGDELAGVERVVLPVSGLRGHVRQRRFAAAVARHARRRPVDLLVGMNKMPGLDVYYAGDACFVAKARELRPAWYRFTPRYRHFAAFERAVFRADGRVRVLALSDVQAERYRLAYDTPRERFHALPPGLERDRGAGGESDAARAELGLGTDDKLLLFVGSGFIRKGLDRVLRALAALPPALRGRVCLCVVGADRERRFRRLAERLGVPDRVRFLGGRDDVPALLAAADGLVLPAYEENTGTVILEGAIAGVPVLTTANCGYAQYIAAAGAGIVEPEPFDQARFGASLERLLTADERTLWAERGRRLGADDGLYEMPERVAALLERLALSTRPRRLVALCAFAYAPTDPACRALAAVARACRARGLDARAYVASWRGAVPADIALARLAAPWTARPRRLAGYQRRLGERLRRDGAQCVVAFGPSLAVADMHCGPELKVRRTPAAAASSWRRVELPPGLGAPLSSVGARPASGDVVFALVGDDLVRHGVDRLLAGLARLPERQRASCLVLAAGRLPRSHLAAARAFAIRVVVDAKADPLAVLSAADVFVELPFAPASNGWIFDALAVGSAVLTHANVAESRLVTAAAAGEVLSSPFRQKACDSALGRLLSCPEQRRVWSANGARFAARPECYDHAERVAATIDEWLVAAERGRAHGALSA